jgi:hypothetical protein
MGVNVTHGHRPEPDQFMMTRRVGIEGRGAVSFLSGRTDPTCAHDPGRNCGSPGVSKEPDRRPVHRPRRLPVRGAAMTGATVRV